MLSGVDACVERVEDLIVARKERVAINRLVATVNRRIELRSRDDETVMNFRDDVLNFDPQIPRGRVWLDCLFNRHDVLARNEERHCFARNSQREIALGVALRGLFACRRARGDACSGDGFVLAGDERAGERTRFSRLSQCLGAGQYYKYKYKRKPFLHEPLSWS